MKSLFLLFHINKEIMNPDAYIIIEEDACDKYYTFRCSECNVFSITSQFEVYQRGLCCSCYENKHWFRLKCMHCFHFFTHYCLFCICCNRE